ncbi:MAG: hypothetical protein N2690_02030, partial [Rhodocyclaceae bacterium]|nr:hypothetical protein [Rhodocyclaceae bacterium]
MERILDRRQRRFEGFRRGEDAMDAPPLRRLGLIAGAHPIEIGIGERPERALTDQGRLRLEALGADQASLDAMRIAGRQRQPQRLDAPGGGLLGRGERQRPAGEFLRPLGLDEMHRFAQQFE